jgi:acyl carrier protein
MFSKQGPNTAAELLVSHLPFLEPGARTSRPSRVAPVTVLVISAVVMVGQAPEAPEARVERLVCEYAQNVPALPLDGALSLREDLAIESLSLVSLTVRLGDELGVDVLDAELELGEVKTVADLVGVAKKLGEIARANGSKRD